MSATASTGSRIRERRLSLGLKQSDIARDAGISAAYLNLIEHNRRRVAGKLLGKLARALDIETDQLARGAGASLVLALRDAAASDFASGSGVNETDVTTADEFAARFAGWADLVVAQHRRIAALEHSVETLTERMAHDPFLSVSLHDLLSAVASINAASTILMDTQDIEGEWRDRFHRNINEDGQRMAEVAQSLATYLDGIEGADPTAATPQEELEHWLATRSYFFSDLEGADPQPLASILDDAEGLTGKAARIMALDHLARYRSDAATMPLGVFTQARDRFRGDPLRLAQHFGADLAAVFRRLSVLPGKSGAGLVTCDASGALTHRKPLDGFALPRFAAACPLWPLFQVLSNPMVPVNRVVDMPGRDAFRFRAYAVAQPVGLTGFDMPLIYESTMLIVPLDRSGSTAEAVQHIGTSCRICPRQDCHARREPTILSGEI